MDCCEGDVSCCKGAWVVPIYYVEVSCYSSHMMLQLQCPLYTFPEKFIQGI